MGKGLGREKQTIPPLFCCGDEDGKPMYGNVYQLLVHFLFGKVAHEVTFCLWKTVGELQEHRKPTFLRTLYRSMDPVWYWYDNQGAMAAKLVVHVCLATQVTRSVGDKPSFYLFSCFEGRSRTRYFLLGLLVWLRSKVTWDSGCRKEGMLSLCVCLCLHKVVYG